MARRKQLYHPDEIKDKIKAGQLIKRLNDHIYSEKPTMEQSQVNAALRLLNKVIPDQKAVDISGSGENGEIIVKIVKGLGS